MSRWFLSYNSIDLPLTEALAARLRANLPGADLFLAPKSLRAGGAWLPKLAEAIAEADTFVMVIGANGADPGRSSNITRRSIGGRSSLTSRSSSS